MAWLNILLISSEETTTQITVKQIIKAVLGSAVLSELSQPN